MTVRDIIHVTEPLRVKVKGAMFDHPLIPGGRAVGMGRFIKGPGEKRIEVDWAQMTTRGSTFLEHAGRITKELGILDLFAPDVDFKAGTCGPGDFKKNLGLGNNRTLLHYEADGDIFYPLKPGQGYYLRSGGCPVIRVQCVSGNQKRTAVGHGGVESFQNGLAEAFVEVMSLTEEEKKRTRIAVIAAIHDRNFTYPTRHKVHAEKNRAFCESLVARWGLKCVPSIKDSKEQRHEHHSGWIHLGHIARAAFEQAGIPASNIEDIAFGIDDSPRHTDGSPRWYTTRNYPQYSADKKEAADWQKRRNGIFVTAE